MLYIRADGNKVIATGHIMRCLSIADAAREKGEDTTFLLADTEAVALLKERDYPYLVLGTKWDNMEAELPVLKRLIREKGIKKLFIDSYQVTFRYLEELTKEVETLYLDDTGSFSYPVSGIICYATYWRDYYGKPKTAKTVLYMGTDYVPLRKEFMGLAPKKIKDQVENLLLLSGGTDVYGILETLLERIKKDNYKRIDVICGSYDTNYENLCRKYRNFEQIRIHSGVTQMRKYMEAADIAVTAGGSTLYELCAVGTPAISYSLADNQLANVRQFQKDGIIEYAGDVRKDDVAEAVSGYLELYRKNRPLREDRARKMQALVDGCGADRIAEILQKEG